MENKTPTFKSLLEQLACNHDAYKVFSAFTTLAACALAHGTREPEYLDEAKRWRKEELGTFSHALALLIMEMQEHPFTDLLGKHYMDFALTQKSQQWRAEYHTPQNICEMMARMIIGDATLSDEGPITLCEPASGSGAMILAFAKAHSPENRRRLRVTAIDISKTACDMCFINTTLWGIPAEIIHGNTLSLKFFARWQNIHWIFRGQLHHFVPALETSVQPETGGQLLENQKAKTLATTLIATAATQQGQPPAPEKIEQIKTALGQQELSFA